MATVYLNPAGDDSRSYATAQNSATPWQTIAKVVSSATNGDSVILAAGTYTWTQTSFSGKTFTLTGPPLANGLPTAIFDAAAGNASWMYPTLLTISNVMFQNATLNGSGTYQILFGGFNPTAGNFAFNNCVIRNCVLHAATYSAVLGSPFGAGFTATLTNCLIYGITTPIGSLASIFDISGTVSLAMNDTTVFNGSGTDPASVFRYTSAGTIVIKNSIISSDAALTWKVGAASPTVTATYSAFYNLSGNPSGTGVITSDPLFVDAANANFKLRPTSPCIDTGTLV